MKSQTKALLASVMVLALALSSIGGVTYSWFSETETGSIKIGTGTANISSKAYADDVELEELSIGVNPGYSRTIKIKVSNEGSLPIDVSAKVTCHQYQMFDSNGNWTSTRLYFQDENTVIETGAYAFQDDVLFGSNQKYTSGGWKTVDKEGTTTGGTRFTSFADFYFYYDLGSQFIPPGQTREFSFIINVTNNYKTNLVENPHIEIEAVQCASIIATMINGTSEIEIENDQHSQSIIFIGNGIIVMVSKEAISQANKVSVEYNMDSNGTRTVTLQYNEGAMTPNSGEVTISFDSPSGNFFGTMTSPASNTTFTFTAGTGESS